jgi:hypothetical protein
MTRRLTTILFATLLLPTIIPAGLSAQGRGHRGGAVGAVRAPISSPRSTSVSRIPPVVTPGLGTPRVSPVAPIVNAPRVFVHPQRRAFIQQPFFGFSPFFSSFYSPYFYDTPYYPSPDYLGQTYIPPEVSQNEADLSYQVQQLSQEVEQLRDQQALASQPSPPPAPAVPEPPPTPTTLVFRDGHRLSIMNYAIVEDMLWVLDENRSDKIPLSDLNLEATEKENRSHGVRFSPPQR